LLFGQAHLIPAHSKDTYITKLRSDYRFYSKKYQLLPLQAATIKQGRMRPAHQPTLRIAQMSAILTQLFPLFDRLVKESDLTTVVEDFENINLSPFWQSHFTFQSSTVSTRGKLGATTTNSIILNAILPVLYLYARTTGSDDLINRILNYFTTLPSEHNSILSKYLPSFISIKNGGDSQAVLQLYHHYCVLKKCLSCAIGHEVLRNQ